MIGLKQSVWELQYLVMETVKAKVQNYKFNLEPRVQHHTATTTAKKTYCGAPPKDLPCTAPTDYWNLLVLH